MHVELLPAILAPDNLVPAKFHSPTTLLSQMINLKFYILRLLESNISRVIFWLALFTVINIHIFKFATKFGFAIGMKHLQYSESQRSVLPKQKISAKSFFLH